MQVIRVPKDRVGVLIGKEGETRRMLERQTGMRFQIDTEGEVSFDDSRATDPLLPLKVLDLIKAIGRGFSPERAIRLLGEDEYFDVIDIDEYVSKRPEQLSRARARVIGSGGNSERTRFHCARSAVVVRSSGNSNSPSITQLRPAISGIGLTTSHMVSSICAGSKRIFPLASRL
ncbi:MAG: KH domain-containing protein [Methanomassiliicoccales archaeon]